MVVTQVLAIFLIMVAGFVARKAEILDGKLVRGLSGFLLNVTLPFTVIAGFDRAIPKSALADLGRVALWSLAIHLFAVAMAAIAWRKAVPEKRKVLSYITVFSNCGFMGFPVIESIFGKIGVMYASVYVMVFTTFVWTYGISLFAGASGPGRLRKVILNPGNIGILIGLALWLLPFSMPRAIGISINLMSSLTTPLSMIVVGATLADVPLRGLFSGAGLWIGTALRLLVLPFAVFLAMRALGATGLAAKVSLVLSAMPAAAQTVIFTERYGGDVSLASRVVLVTTILSLLSVPVFATLAG